MLFQINSLTTSQDGCRKEQQDAEPHQLPDAGDPAGRAHLHRPVQGVRQAHERHSRRLRGVPQAEAQVCQGGGEGGEEGAGARTAQGREYR